MPFSVTVISLLYSNRYWYIVVEIYIYNHSFENDLLVVVWLSWWLICVSPDELHVLEYSTLLMVEYSSM